MFNGLPFQAIKIIKWKKITLALHYRTIGPGTRRQDKGHGAEVKAFVEAVSRGGPSPIAFEEIVEVTSVTLELVVDGRE